MSQKEYSLPYLFDSISYYLRVWASIFRKSLSKSIAYRFELISKLLRTGLIVALQLILIHSIYSGAKYIEGWSIDDYYLLVGVYNFINYVSWGIFNVNFWRLEEKILKGQFDFLLLYPSGSIFTASFIEFFLDDAVAAISGLMLMGYYVVLHYSELTVSGVVGGILAIGIGFLVWYSLHLLVAAFNFISPKNGLLDLFKSLSRIGSFPIDIFSQNVRVLLYSLFPVALVAAVPARVISGVYSWEFLVYGGLVGVIFFFIAVRFWHFAMRQYTSAGG